MHYFRFSPVFSSPVVARGGVINNNVRRRKAEDKMAMIFVAIVSGKQKIIDVIAPKCPITYLRMDGLWLKVH